MSLRWKKSRERINKAREKKETRRLQFFYDLVARKAPYNGLYITQGEWSNLENQHVDAAVGLDRLEIARNGFCCTPFSEVRFAKGWVSALKRSKVISLLPPYLDIKCLYMGGQIPHWTCHENTGELIFSSRFIHDLINNTYPYWIRNETSMLRHQHTHDRIRREMSAILRDKWNID